MSPLRFGIHWIVPLAAALGILGGGAWLLVLPIVIFALVPLADELSLDTENPDEAELARRAATHGFELWLLLWVPCQLALVAWGIFEVVHGGRSSAERVGIVVDLGLTCGGVGNTIAHELMHRPGRFHRALAELLMTVVSYPHFCIEHVLGHHRNVATDRDPATARLGENVYLYLPRTIAGGLASAFRLETARVARRGRRLGLGDRRIRMPLLLVATYAGTWAAFGQGGVLALAGVGAVATFLLEVINYVEHYGLVRRQLPGGDLERVSPAHSWNAAERVSSALLFELPRHADHHANASRPYWALRHFPEAPQLPAGYSAMLLCALVPPLWRRVMDPRVLAWRERSEIASPTSAHGNAA
jgi:alkane 1-monooxygenase